MAAIFLLHTPSLEVLPAPTSLAKSSVSSGLESDCDEDKASSAQGANQQLKAEQNASEPSASEYSDFESVFTREDLDWQLPLRNDTPALKRELRELVTAHQISNSAFLSSSHSQQALDNPTLEEFLPLLPLRPDSRSLTESPWASLIEKNSSP